MKIKGNILEAFELLKKSMWIRYRGCLIDRQGGKFTWMGKQHDTLEEAKASIDEAYDQFDYKINKSH